MEGKDPNLGVKPPKKKEQEKRENYIYKRRSFEKGKELLWDIFGLWRGAGLSSEKGCLTLILVEFRWASLTLAQHPFSHHL
jgi:hypothetical protein